MTRRQLTRRLRALSTDERGFSLLETMVAIMVIFGSILTLAFAALTSFRYQGVARQRQTANGVAARLMEDMRGLAYARVTSGLLSTDLSGDANIVDCSGIARFLSCTANDEAGSGERIVHNPGLASVMPLVPHRSTSSTAITSDGVRYDWATYVTRDDSVSTAPYRVTVVVTWTEGISGGAKYVRIQSLFWSPSGCRDTASHPFAAPCQPFLLGNATVPNGGVSTVGAIDGISFSSLEISLMGVTATGQQEQISGAQGSAHAVQATIKDVTTRIAGGATASTDADLDPNTTATDYARVRCATEVSCTGGTLTSPSGGGPTYVQITVPTTTAGETASAATAKAGSPCPPAAISATAETDNQPCSGAIVQQPSAMLGVAHLHAVQGLNLGDAILARVGIGVSNSARAFVNRVINPAPVGAVCTPGAGTNGCISATASRTYGNIRIGGLPEEVDSDLGYPFNVSSNCGGYFLSLVSYADTATASAGEGTPLPTASAASGTLYYYRQSTNSCQSVALSGIDALNVSFTSTTDVSGTPVTVTISTVPDGMVAPSSATSATPGTTGSPQPTRTASSAQVVAPKLTLRYVITIPGRTLVDLTQTVALGTLEANATYEPAPSST